MCTNNAIKIIALLVHFLWGITSRHGKLVLKSTFTDNDAISNWKIRRERHWRNACSFLHKLASNMPGKNWAVTQFGSFYLGFTVTWPLFSSHMTSFYWIGTYNMLLTHCPLYDAKNTTFQQSHDLFHSCFTDGFPWEVLEVLSGKSHELCLVSHMTSVW